MKEDGGPVFPQKINNTAYFGLSLRDTIAIIRMASRSFGTLGAMYAEPEHIAKDAYKTADAMLAERAK